jgi:hypothetical protein
MKATEIKIKVSPLTNTIYAGKINKKGNEWLEKVDLTEEILSAVAQYMDGNYTEIDFGVGKLKWESNK